MVRNADIAMMFLLAGALFALHVGELERGVTGLLTFEHNLSVSVNSATDGEVSVFDFQQFILIENSTDIHVELRNTGSTPIERNTYEVGVYDVNNTLLYSYPGPEFRLEPGEHRGRTIKHTPHETGTYIIRIEAEMGQDVIRSARFLLVQEPPDPVQPEPVTIVRKRVRYVSPPPLPEEEPPTRSWRVEAPRTVTLSQNGSTTVPIRINNTGEARINNVYLSTRSSRNLSLEYEPKILFTVPSGAASTFLVTLTPDEGVRTDQNLSYTVTSEGLEQRSQVQVNIEPTLTIQQLRQELAKLEALVRDAETELQLARDNGLDVSEPSAELEAVRDRLETADQHIEDGELDAAQQELDDARSEISDVFQMLFKLRSEQLIVTAPLVQPVHLLLLGAVLVAILMVAGYYYVKEHHEDRPKLLRDMEEE